MSWCYVSMQPLPWEHLSWENMRELKLTMEIWKISHKCSRWHSFFFFFFFSDKGWLRHYVPQQLKVVCDRDLYLPPQNTAVLIFHFCKLTSCRQNKQQQTTTLHVTQALILFVIHDFLEESYQAQYSLAQELGTPSSVSPSASHNFRSTTLWQI